MIAIGFPYEVVEVASDSGDGVGGGALAAGIVGSDQEDGGLGAEALDITPFFPAHRSGHLLFQQASPATPCRMSCERPFHRLMPADCLRTRCDAIGVERHFTDIIGNDATIRQWPSFQKQFLGNLPLRLIRFVSPF